MTTPVFCSAQTLRSACHCVPVRAPITKERDSVKKFTYTAQLDTIRNRPVNGIRSELLSHVVSLQPREKPHMFVDSRGRVPGVNTAIIPMAQGIGFSVPANTAKVGVVAAAPLTAASAVVILGISGRSRPVHRRLARLHELADDRGMEPMARRDRHACKSGTL